MNKFTKILILSQFIAILILLFLFTRKSNTVPEYIDHHHYHTDTLYVDEPFSDVALKEIKEKVSKGKIAPPKEIVIYETEYIPTTIEITPDSILLLVDELRDSLEISKKYLINFPNKPKLIALELAQNNLDITLLDINGDVKTNKYPLFLKTYDYTHLGDSLIYNKTKNPEPDLKGALYGTSGYSILDKNLYIGGRYQINHKRFLLEANTEITLEQEPALFIKVGAALRIR